MTKPRRDTNLPGLVALHRDAKFLLSEGRNHGALLVLLCIVDGLASIKYPSMARNENRKRYCNYGKAWACRSRSLTNIVPTRKIVDESGRACRVRGGEKTYFVLVLLG